MNKAAKMIKVDVYSDIACPWCYVGEKKFKLGIEAFTKKNPGCGVEVAWHAYMIDPATKKQGEDYMAYNVRRWGGDGWTHELRDAGKAVGCTFANWKVWPNTFLAHCLIASASQHGKADPVLDEIFRLCYEAGANVSDAKVLDNVAKQFDLPEDWKTAEQQRVLEDDRTAKEDLDIHGVPYFLIDGKTALEGAHGPESFLKAFANCLK